MNVSERNEPLLPNGHLKNGSPIFFAFVKQNRQIGQKQTFDVEDARRLLGIPGKRKDREMRRE